MRIIWRFKMVWNVHCWHSSVVLSLKNNLSLCALWRYIMLVLYIYGLLKLVVMGFAHNDIYIFLPFICFLCFEEEFEQVMYVIYRFSNKHIQLTNCKFIELYSRSLAMKIIGLIQVMNFNSDVEIPLSTITILQKKAVLLGCILVARS